MSSCEANPPLAFQAGVCSGAGICVNSTKTPGRLLCLCNSGYSGASDYFDNRIELQPDGTYLSLDCGESKAGTCIIWGLVLLFSIIRTKQVMTVFFKFYRQHFADERKRKAGFLADFPLRTLTFDLVMTSSLLFIVAISKICGLTFGTDILPTVSVGFLVLCFNHVTFEIGRREFSIFLQGTMSAKAAASITRFRTGLKLFGNLVYACIAIIPGIWALTLDKTVGPLENNESNVILIRNIGTVCWGILDICSVWMVKTQLESLMRLTSSDNNDHNSNDAHNRSSKKVELATKTVDVIKRLAFEIRSLIIFLAVLAILYGVFTVPILYPYQTYCIGFIIGLGSLRHSGKSFTDGDAQMRNNITVAIAEGTDTIKVGSFTSVNGVS
jgi:hypothetical protein